MDADMMLTSRRRKRLGQPAWGPLRGPVGAITIPNTALPHEHSAKLDEKH